MVRACCLLSICGLLAGCRSVSPPTPLSELNAQQTQGHAVFQSHCGQCHSDRTHAALHGPALAGLFKKQTLPSGAPANDERVISTIVNGHGLMPAMGNTLDQRDLTDLLAYLHTV